MALIPQTGAGDAGANTYATLAEARAYATARGTPLPADDAAANALLLKAMEYLEALWDQYKGVRRFTSQILSWPRTLVLDFIAADQTDSATSPAYRDETVIPLILKHAQIQLAIEAQTVDLMPANVGGVAVLKEKVGPIETTYAVSQTGLYLPIFPRVDALLSPLLIQQRLRVVRI